MSKLDMYLQTVEGQLERTGRVRESKREKEILELVKRFISEGKPTTIKAIQSELDISKPQQVHQVVKKSSVLSKVKVKGFTLIVPSEEEVDEVEDVENIEETVETNDEIN